MHKIPESAEKTERKQNLRDQIPDSPTLPGDSPMRAAMFVLVAGLALPSAGARADDPPKGWEFVGRTEAVTVEVRAQVTGHLTRVAVREGAAVAKGDLLAV